MGMFQKEDPEMHGDVQELERQKTIEGDAHFSRLGWKRFAVICIVQSIALGTLSLPAAFASLGMLAGVIICISTGVAAIYASYIIGQVKLKYPHVQNYVDLGALLGGRVGAGFVATCFVCLATLTIGSHCLTGKIAISVISNSTICGLWFGLISAVILFLLAIPPSFTELAILGYIDFTSIILAIGITMIVTGVSPDIGDGEATWSAWPKPGLTLSEAVTAVNNIVFAYGFAMAQPSFMAELHTPESYINAIWVLGSIEILVYTLTGAIIYSSVGMDVQSPALLSAGPLWSKVAFGVALPVIFISGALNTTAICRYMHDRWYKNSVVRYVNTPKGWSTWLGIIFATTLLAWIIAEAIPFFSDLLSIGACLFVSAFSFYLPALMWFKLLKEDHWYSRKNIIKTVSNGVVLVIGVVVFGLGLYASVQGLITNFRDNAIRRPFTCSTN